MATVVARLVGRGDELAEIGRFLDDVDGGHLALLLQGEPGIGKTSLWAGATELALARRYRVLKAAPAQIEMSLPYAVLGDLLDPYPEAAVAALPAPMRTALEAALLRAAAEQAPADQLAVSNGVSSHAALPRLGRAGTGGGGRRAVDGHGLTPRPRLRGSPVGE